MFSIFSEDAIPLKIELFLRFLVSTKILAKLSFQRLEWIPCVISASLGNSYKNCNPDQTSKTPMSNQLASTNQVIDLNWTSPSSINLVDRNLVSNRENEKSGSNQCRIDGSP